MTGQDAIHLVEILIWPLIALVAIVVVGFYQLARLAITGKGMQSRAGGVDETERSSVRGFQRG